MDCDGSSTTSTVALSAVGASGSTSPFEGHGRFRLPGLADRLHRLAHQRGRHLCDPVSLARLGLARPVASAVGPRAKPRHVRRAVGSRAAAAAASGAPATGSIAAGRAVHATTTTVFVGPVPSAGAILVDAVRCHVRSGCGGDGLDFGGVQGSLLSPVRVGDSNARTCFGPGHRAVARGGHERRRYPQVHSRLNVGSGPRQLAQQCWACRFCPVGGALDHFRSLRRTS